MEGLFRNGANPSFAEKMVSVNVVTEQFFGEEKRNAIYTKLIYFLKRDDNADLIQIVYHNKNMDSASIMKASYIKDVSRKIRRDTKKNRMLLFSLFEMFYLNRSGAIGYVLKKADPSFVQNKEIVNREARNLYRKYLNHLRRGKDVSNFNFEEEKKQVGSFYKKDPAVKLVKMAERFYWKVDLRNVQALFTNETHQLRELSLNFLGENISVSTIGFDTYSNNYKLPKGILFENETGEKFLFQTLSFKVFNGSKKYMQKTAEKYINDEEKFRNSKSKIKFLLKDSLDFYY